jgi:DNA-binding MarR family transcriptional regulator
MGMSSRARSPQLDEQLCFALYRASRALIRAYTPVLAPLGVTYPQYLALLALWEEDDIPVKRLGERLALDSATLTPLLKRLEQQGLLGRHRDPADERVVRLRLTPAGRALRAKSSGIQACVAAAAGFDVDDPRSMARLRGLQQELAQLASVLEAD